MNFLPLTNDNFTLCGPGEGRFSEDTLSLRDAWAVYGDDHEDNAELRFLARAPEGAPQVEIWASVRYYNRSFRYMVGLRGGSHKHLYLSRLGSGGYDRVLAVCPLDFLPQPGVWYALRIVCAGDSIAVYLGNEDRPRILCRDDDAPFASGSVALGGGYIETEYRDVTLTPVKPDALDGVAAWPGYLETMTLSPEEKARKRRRDRAMYRPFTVARLSGERMEMNLAGSWLFIPEDEVKDDPAQLLCDDSSAHVMTVPEPWTPLFAWLEGEAYGPEQMNKGQSDNFYLEELIRCRNLTFDYETTQTAWYRHYLDLPAGIENKAVALDFEGIALVSEIYINGDLVRENIGMFAPMRVDIGEHVRPGRNVIAVKVSRVVPDAEIDARDSIDDKYTQAREAQADAYYTDKVEHRPFNTDDLPHGFYSNHPGGIWRSVRLIITDKTRVEDVWFRPRLDGASLEVEIAHGGRDSAECALYYDLTHTATGECLCGGEVCALTLRPGESRTVRFDTPLVAPRLWEPGKPNLYRLTLKLKRGGETFDAYTEKVGFRTVSTDGSRLIYNGRPLWVRGGNHMPAHVRPNDAVLAQTFIRMSLEHNVIATRSHVSPWNDVWLDAADENGLMVSFEGTWPWLMLAHIPSERSLDIWKSELKALYRRHRNRPSLFMITMNNEMNFYLSRGSDEAVREKGYRVQGGLRIAREMFPDLPLVCDSGYNRSPTLGRSRDLCFPYANGRYERITQPEGYDDGDVDDPHFYYGWYDKDFFHFMNGEFGHQETIPGRPCLLQECSVGYCRDEDGHAVRFYTYQHQTPQSTVGQRAYEHNDPEYFQTSHAFQVKGLAEMFRRVEHERVCGILLFAFETWFYFHYDPRRVHPMLSAQRLKMAYQPVLASADLFARHFFAGCLLQTDVIIMNDDREKPCLRDGVLTASLTAGEEILACARYDLEDIPYFGTEAVHISLPIPERLPAPRTDARLVLKVLSKDELVSENDYDVMLAEAAWANDPDKAVSACYLKSDTAAEGLLARHHIAAKGIETAPDTPKDAAALVIAKPVGAPLSRQICEYIRRGGRAILVNQRDLRPELVDGRKISYTEDMMEIVTMNVPESRVFAGLEERDTAWFDNGRDVPFAAYGRYGVDRMDEDICALGEALQWHNYISKPTDYQLHGGTPLFTLRVGQGEMLISCLRTDADDRDPIACRLTDNILTWYKDGGR